MGLRGDNGAGQPGDNLTPVSKTLISRLVKAILVSINNLAKATLAAGGGFLPSGPYKVTIPANNGRLSIFCGFRTENPQDRCRFKWTFRWQ